MSKHTATAILIVFLMVPIPVATQDPPSDKSVFLVRHGKKHFDNSDYDNPLAAEGKEWAKRLWTKLQSENDRIGFVFTTRCLRTIQTAAPFMTQRDVETEFYLYNKCEFEGRKFDASALANRVCRASKEKAVLVVGHMETLLETIQALKCKYRPAEKEQVGAYGFLFVCKCNGTLEVRKVP